MPAAIGQLGGFSRAGRDPRERVITIALYALVKAHEVVGGDDTDEAAWFPVDDIPLLTFDHEQIFNEAILGVKSDVASSAQL